jgi:Ni,Fe-hydrogenase III small subunit/formate hydrogenlyase subunit 6/NADH:ubiquinone oxidoreductase subunit I
MLKETLARIRQKHRTIRFPKAEPVMPERFAGMPRVEPTKCTGDCDKCVSCCPVGAITAANGKLCLDAGKCIFCRQCEASCPHGAITFSKDYSMAARAREDLLIDGSARKLAEALDERSRRIFGHSLKLRQVSAGGCNACEADTNVLTTIVFDLGRFGIQFVASPRHADGLLITGPVPQNMELALQKTWAATPEPKFVIAVGACAISGGPYIGHSEVCGGADKVLPVDLYVPGCPPHPVTILDGLLGLLGRLESR